MKAGRIFGYLIILLLSHAELAISQEQQFGDISFPNSGADEAQSAFLTGVTALHSFEYGPARIAFEEAQAIDPSFALAYWGQAMSDNHPLWAEQDVDAATAALNRLAPDFQGRLNKAPTEKEKAYLTGAEILYFSPGDKLQRDFAYSEHMARMHERWPDDHEISIFYALSLLGTVRGGPGIPATGAGRGHQPGRFCGKRESSGCGAPSLFIRSMTRTMRFSRCPRQASLCGNRAGGRTRAAHAFAHIRAAWNVAGGRQLEYPLV